MEDGKSCSTNSTEKKCCWTKCIISVVAVFAFTMVFDWLVHGSLMKGLYAANAGVFRPEDQMQKMMPFCLLFHLVVAIVVTSMFKKYRNCDCAASCSTGGEPKKCCPHKRGMCFGLHLGLIFGAGMFATYIWMPVTIDLAYAWFGAGLAKGILVGLLLGALCGKKKACA